MTTINKVEDADLRTDACPTTPNKETGRKKIDEEIEDAIPSTFKINKKKPKTKKLSNGPVANIINIADCVGVQIGKSITYNIQKKDTKDEFKKKQYNKTETIDKLLNCTDRVTEDDIMFVSTHVGEGWRDIGRKLKYSPGQIHQFEEDHRIKGIKEVIYQLLLDWIQNDPEAATLGKLNTVLWETQQEEVVQMLSEKLTL